MGNGHRKPPYSIKPKAQKNKTKEENVTNTAELVIPLNINTLYADVTTKTHKKKNRRSRNKKKSVAEQQINKKKHSEINDIIEQYAEIKAVKKNNKKSDFHQIFKYESTAKQQQTIK